MSVMFKTQQGRTLCNDEMDVDDMTRAVGALIEVTGYEHAFRHIMPSAQGQITFHVNTRHVVEWWTQPSLPNAPFATEVGSHA